jgi:hypothetical protein
MAMKSVWGFGNAKFYYNGTTVSFPAAQGQLWFQQVGNQYVAKDGTLRNILHGYRAMMSIRLWNTAADGSDAVLMQSLFSLITAANGAAITVYPRYNASTSSTLGFPSILTSTDIKLIDGAPNVAVGQYIDLEFACIYLLSQIPTLVDNPSIYSVIDENDNQIVDEYGNPITMEL